MAKDMTRQGTPLWREMLTGLGGPNVELSRLVFLAKLKLVVVVPLVYGPVLVAVLQFDGSFAGMRALFWTWLALAAVEVVVNVGIVVIGRSPSAFAAASVRTLTYVSLTVEVADNLISTFPFGVLITPAAFYLAFIVAAYRIVTDYRIGLWAVFVSAVGIVLTVAIETSAWVQAHPALPNTRLPYYETMLNATNASVTLAIGLVLIFVVTNYAMNRSLQLHRYITESVLRRYLPASMVARAARGELHLDGEPERITITVMFADMVGFSSMSEKLPPEKLARVVNGYLSLLANLAHEHGATVDKFVGDAVMVVFGAPDQLPEQVQAERCVALARDVQEALETAIDGVQVSTRIGINTGEAVVGNFGSQIRSDYTVIGPTVNIAARLEAASETGRILVGPRTAELLGDHYEFEATPPLQLKGIGKPVTAYFVQRRRT